MNGRAWNSTLRPGQPPVRHARLQGGARLARSPLSRIGRKTLERGRQQWNSGLHPFPAAVCVLIDARDICQPDEVRCCQRCGSTRNLQRHHRRGKASGGSDNRPHTQCPCNAVTLCLSCHFWAHTDGRAQAEDEGFIVSQAVDQPGSIGVMRFAAADGGATQFPSCDGRWLESAPEMREVA